MEKLDLLKLTATISAAYLSMNEVRAGEVPGLVGSIFDTLQRKASDEPEPPQYEPAVDPKKSIKPDHLISLIDGQPYKMLKRHLSTNGLTPEEYRQRYGLPSDYPMVARRYADRRREIAKENGLGRGNHSRSRKRA